MKLIYSPVGNKQEAEKIAQHVLVQKLAACVNIIPGMISYYWWEGNIDSSEEVLLLAKTTDALANKAQEAIVKIHSYECPCVLILPVESANTAFETWLNNAG